ncbi:TetR/AcrR family transcriptional regulator [Paenibacillus psychroresistens]|uniref:TetR/AcrR family transcriptional regulator n=1 Tax=Paenibacillus psychroresistens TaxID=1778678 RepID=A0A6B8RF17_9BACL|nr:TetR/AcrR family transcriptional regulator [Paenibacillus psychroresistens]QGQ94113.1 TetR/AcrR family transcriptional regulator [Paenibacillus psychroresistens]
MSELDKREKIIAAAYNVLSVKGYDLASTKEIARTAGVAQGLINYYFPSKDLLFAEVFRRETAKYCESFEFLKHLDNKPLTIETIKELLEEPKTRVISDPDWYTLRNELSAIGLRGGNTSEILKEMLTTKRKFIGGIVEAVTHLPQEQASTIASILYAVFEGLGLQKIADPEFNYDQAFDTLAVMLGAYLEAISPKKEES